jgi:hypothetical protein
MRHFFISSLLITGLAVALGQTLSAEIKLSITPSVADQADQDNARTGQGDFSFRLNLDKPAKVEIGIYNSSGKRVAVLRKNMAAGPGVLVWRSGPVMPGKFQAQVKINGVKKKTRIEVVK